MAFPARPLLPTARALPFRDLRLLVPRSTQSRVDDYADLIRMAADLGADGVDLTAYWLADTSDQTLFPLKKLAYKSAVSIYTIGIGARLAQPTPELQAAEVETVRKWIDVAQRLGAGHVRVFGGAVPKGATEEQAAVWAVETLKRAPTRR
jgi:sugar phosphate isomerase/epimerase